MHELPETLITNRLTTASYELPKTVKLVCPFCAEKVVFTLRWSHEINENLTHTTGVCPNCDRSCIFAVVKFAAVEDGSNKLKRGRLFVHPAPKIRQPIDGFDKIDALTDGVKRAYLSAISAYNFQEWSLTATAIRRFLEGLAKTSVSKDDEGKDFYHQIDSLTKKIGNALVDLAKELRRTGNLGAHFDLEREPNEEVATLMLNLVDFLIEYMFVLPNKVESLREKVSQLDPPNSVTPE